MDRRETRESVNSGCNCLIISVIVLAFVISCARSLINGDIKLPRFGSSHVSGGSGSYGTSNGYNVEYKQTTAPNNNSSLRDYTETNSQPTEYREGMSKKNTNSVSSSSSSPVETKSFNDFLNSSSSSKPVDNINNNSTKPVTYFKTCEWCKGTGKRESGEFFDGNTVISTKCLKCGRTDTHSHRYIIDCPACSGKGKIKMKKEKGILGEMEMRSLD